MKIRNHRLAQIKITDDRRFEKNKSFYSLLAILKSLC